MGYLLTLLIFLITCFQCMCFTTVINADDTAAVTSVSPKNNTSTGTITHKVVNKPHHLFIGRCKPDDQVIHQENIIVYNDGKSHVAAAIKVQVTDPVYLTCVKIFDEIPDGKGGYPSYVAGGVGEDYVEFNVDTEYGRGFHFYIQLFGYSLVQKENNVR